MANIKQKFKVTSIPIVDADGYVRLDEAYSRLRNGCINPYHGFQCRQCANCMAQNTNKWVSRLLHQATISYKVLSFCLTYTDAQLDSCEVDAGRFDEVERDGKKYFGYKHSMSSPHSDYHGLATLSKRDFQLFMKRLRSKIDVDVKYFCKGEYGTLEHPHMHVILFLLSLCSVEAIKDAILASWFDGIEKYDYEDFPNMTRKRNLTKKIGVNPIVSFGEFDEDTARYCTKYVSKASLIGCKASHIVPEFTLSSRKLAVDYYQPQIIEKRTKLAQLASSYKNMDDDVFEHRFKSILTFQANTGATCFFPNFLRTTFFKGYYVYSNKDESLSLTRIMVNGKIVAIGAPSRVQQSDKNWHSVDDDREIEMVDVETGVVAYTPFGQWLFDEYSLMLQRFLKISFNKYFGVNDDQVVVHSSSIKLQVQQINRKISDDLQTCKNRIDGARKKMEEKKKKALLTLYKRNYYDKKNSSKTGTK